MEDVVPDADVDGHGRQDADPDEHVITVDADWVPVITDPTPDLEYQKSATGLSSVDSMKGQDGLLTPALP